MEEVGAEAFCRRVRELGEEHPLFPLKAQLSRPLGSDAQSAGPPTVPTAKNAAGLMQGSGLHHQPTSDGLARALAWLLARGDEVDELRPPMTRL